ncbi:hypothetical protein [Heyndrickxia oleronia]|uniref:Uncharacterized protein n=1 Tax=Heyndrickxia oleronia TaxID=38875 RepID=A0AAW6SU85_9BACI|nr:hypothetical protein [Heyndrickxia oleronia]MDH5161743.1 hypothetical protein [Heyndrickxia oleronia]
MRSIRWMFLGLCIMIAGGFIIIDPSSNWGGIQLVLLGLCLSIVGFFIKEK